MNAPLAKLTEEEVIEIRNSDLTQKELAEKYNVTIPTIKNVLTGKTWKHLPGARKSIKPHLRNAKLTENDVLAIRKSSLKQLPLAKIYGVTVVTISNIVQGTTWSHVGGVKKNKIRKLTKKDVVVIRASKLSQGKLSKKYHVSLSTIWKALHGVTFTELSGAKPLQKKSRKQSSFKNVNWNEGNEYWLAQFTSKGKVYYCGTYDFPGEANEAVLKKRAALKAEGIG